MRTLGLALCVWPGLAFADAPLGAKAFEEFSTGKTITYVFEGQVFGREEYGAGRKVTWQTGSNGPCVMGRWFERSPGVICFDYGDRPHCLWFFREGGKVSVRSVREPEKPPLHVGKVTNRPLNCPLTGAGLQSDQALADQKDNA